MSLYSLVLDDLHLHCLLISTEAEYFIHLQASWNLVGDEQHGDFSFQLVDCFREIFRRLLVEVGDGFIEDEDLRFL